MVEKIKLGILDACVSKNIYIERKNEAKIENWGIVIELNWVFARPLTNFGFRCRIISVKVLMFGVNILLDVSTEMLMITKLKN